MLSITIFFQESSIVRCEKIYMRETDESRIFCFRFSVSRANATAAIRETIFPNISFLCARHCERHCERCVFGDAASFLNQKRDAGNGETQKERRPKSRQIRAYLRPRDKTRLQFCRDRKVSHPYFQCTRISENTRNFICILILT